MNVTAIIAVYNGADRLHEAIDSVLAQALPPHELIVVDDGSTDATPQIIESYGNRLRAFRRPHRGLSATHNFAISQASGDTIAFLDHDDLWTPSALKVLGTLLQSAPDLDIACGKVEMRYERSTPPSPAMERCLVETSRPFMMHSLLIRRRVFDRIGTFDERFTHGMDVDWYMRARDRGARFGTVPEVTLVYRMHDTNMTRDIFATTQGILGAFKNSLDRRRQTR